MYASKFEQTLFYISLVLVIIGGVNWGIQAFSGKDLLYYIIVLTKKSGGSVMVGVATDEDKYPENEATKIIPRVVYGLVFLGAVILAVLAVKHAVTTSGSDQVAVVAKLPGDKVAVVSKVSLDKVAKASLDKISKANLDKVSTKVADVVTKASTKLTKTS